MAFQVQNYPCLDSCVFTPFEVSLGWLDCTAILPSVQVTMSLIICWCGGGRVDRRYSPLFATATSSHSSALIYTRDPEIVPRCIRLAASNYSASHTLPKLIRVGLIYATVKFACNGNRHACAARLVPCDPLCVGLYFDQDEESTLAYLCGPMRTSYGMYSAQ